MRYLLTVYAPTNPYPMLRGLGRLGAATAGQVETAAASTAAGVAAGAAYGSVVPGIGTAVGAVVGLIAGQLFNKNYLNVAQMNQAENQEVAAFNAYKAIQGKAPGRQYGLATMTAVWKGALHSGYFHLNNQKQCFHEGCSEYPGNASWIDTTINNADAPYQFPNVYQAWLAGRSSGSPAGAAVVTVPSVGNKGVAVRGVVLKGLGAYSRNVVNPNLGRMPRVHPYYDARRRMMLSGLSGFGVLGAAAAPTPDAVTFVDRYFIPAAQAHDPTPWEVPSNNIEHQILYDVADAYLAGKPVTTTPYVAAAPAPLPPPPKVIPAASTVGTAKQGAIITRQVATAAPTPPPLAATVTTQVASTPPAVAAAAGSVTTAAAATQANLDAALAAQGFTRVGTDGSGFPLYSYGGNIYSYQNGQLFPAGSTAQLATTGNAGTGISTPAAGVDPATASLVQSMMAQGSTPAAAIAAAEQQLQSQGVPITPDIYSQLQALAVAPAPSGVAGIDTGTWLLIGGGVLVFLMLRKPSRST